MSGQYVRRDKSRRYLKRRVRRARIAAMTAEMHKRAALFRRFFVVVPMTDVERDTPDPDYGL